MKKKKIIKFSNGSTIEFGKTKNKLKGKRNLMEQEPTCQHCSWCPDCDEKECNHIEPKTEGRECGHGFDNCAICWGGQHNKWCNHSGSPKQDTWEEKIRKKINGIEAYDYSETTEEIISDIRSELQKQRQEIVRKVEIITDKKNAKRIADLNEEYLGSRDCKMCGQNPEEWRRKLLDEL